MLIAIRLVQLDWNTATIGFLDSITYVLAMLVFAYAFVLERNHTGPTESVTSIYWTRIARMRARERLINSRRRTLR